MEVRTKRMGMNEQYRRWVQVNNMSYGRDGAQQRDENRENCKEGAGSRMAGQVDELGER